MRSSQNESHEGQILERPVAVAKVAGRIDLESNCERDVLPAARGSRVEELRDGVRRDSHQSLLERLPHRAARPAHRPDLERAGKVEQVLEVLGVLQFIPLPIVLGSILPQERRRRNVEWTPATGVGDLDAEGLNNYKRM